MTSQQLVTHKQHNLAKDLVNEIAIQATPFVLIAAYCTLAL
jgi:hypothetical protein